MVLESSCNLSCAVGSELEEKTAEVEQLKGSLQQLQELSSYSQLKEENAILRNTYN